MKQFVEDMKTLRKNMIPEKGHSTAYQKLANAIDAASKLSETTADMSEKQKKEAYIQASLDVVYAADNYSIGKEKERRTQEGTDCFDNAMDALAIVSKHTGKARNQPMNLRVSDIVGRIANKRDAAGQDMADFGLYQFEQSYGASRAKNRMKQIMAKKKGKNKGKNKENNMISNVNKK